MATTLSSSSDRSQRPEGNSTALPSGSFIPTLPECRTLLWSTTVSTGERFHAVLHVPNATKYLDAFYVEVGSEMSGFDRIIYAHIREGQEPLAMYVGEIYLSQARSRSQRSGPEGGGRFARRFSER